MCAFITIKVAFYQNSTSGSKSLIQFEAIEVMSLSTDVTWRLFGLAAQHEPKGGSILFVRGETQIQDRDGTGTSRVINPDEINIDFDDDDEEHEDEADDSECTL